VKNTRDLVQYLLEATEPGGYDFTKTIIYILKHEKNMVSLNLILNSKQYYYIYYIYFY